MSRRKHKSTKELKPLTHRELERVVTAVFDVKLATSICWESYGQTLQQNGMPFAEFEDSIQRAMHIDDIVDMLRCEDANATHDLVQRLRRRRRSSRINSRHFSKAPSSKHRKGQWHNLYQTLGLKDYDVSWESFRAAISHLEASNEPAGPVTPSAPGITDGEGAQSLSSSHSTTRSGARYRTSTDDKDLGATASTLPSDIETRKRRSTKSSNESIPIETQGSEPRQTKTPTDGTPVKSASKRRKTHPSTPAKSPYFSSKKTADSVVAIPFLDSKAQTKAPPLPKGHSVTQLKAITEDKLGLMQERCWQDPFRMLINCMLLNRTKGKSVLPISAALFERYPTPSELADAKPADVREMVEILGLGKQRSEHMIRMAQLWRSHPPRPGVRYKDLNYPLKGDGRGVATIKPDVAGDHDDTDTSLLEKTDGPQIAILQPDDDDNNDGDSCRGGTEISHLPGIGPYAYDAWRMFCRDVFRGLATGYNGEGASGDFEPEWKRIDSNKGRLPTRQLDKELRVFLVWMWLKEGIWWDPDTGEKRVVGEEEMELARGGEFRMVVPETLTGAGVHGGQEAKGKRRKRRKKEESDDSSLSDDGDE